MNVETHSCFPAAVVIAVSSCPSGWTLTYDNPGSGYSQTTVASCDECYTSCANDATCLNFECSPTGLMCYLYAVQGPVTGSMLGDYFQCDKLQRVCNCLSISSHHTCSHSVIHISHAMIDIHISHAMGRA